MKITCQACQAKYTIADEKIQGKVAKIRCRKCGATVLVDASAGSGGAAAKAESPPASTTDSWMVSVAEGDQRTMTTQDVVAAYGSSVVTGDTYVWKDGMADWQPIAEVGELMAVIQSAAPVAESLPSSPPAPDFAAAPAIAPVAARRDPARAGAADLFAAGRIEDEVATSAPPQVLARGGYGGGGAAASASVDFGTQSNQAGLTGARDEHSVLFSLSALTGGTKEPAAPSPIAISAGAPPPRNEDSGLIDLNALAQAQKARLNQPADAVSANPFVFPAALGTVEVPRAEAPAKSRMPMFIGGGIAIVGIIAAVIILAMGKKEEAPPPAASAAVSAAPAEPSVTAATTTTPAASASADTAAADSAAANKGVRKAGGPARPTPGRAANQPVATAPPAPVLPPPKKSPCGCATGDLQCQIRCSAMGH
ncbi:MAG TPA: zinc-ribbon domain-containing protein [Polyangiaceae bacterium]|jgi:predicted Zn finger-like uncharacterized protein